MIILIDNYDSFTHNLYQYFREISDEAVEVLRHDELSVSEIMNRNPDHIVIGPGPGRPENAGISLDLIKTCAGKIPVLGICLGHQVIAQAFGAEIVQSKQIVHGKTEAILHDGKGLFRSIPQNTLFTRYHSLVVSESTLFDDFEISARSVDGDIMGIRHREFFLEGVQFHPESIASEYGKQILRNFLHYRREPFMVQTRLQALIAGSNMSEKEAEDFMTELTEGNLSDIQIAAFLTALNAKGITSEEIAGCARVLQRKRVPVTCSLPLLDTCGTGGDGLGTFNISSMAALVSSACGASVAKHGNRAVSSKSGSADFYRALGLDIDLTPDEAEKLLQRNHFAFLFAPVYHNAMKYAAAARKDLKIKTIMNLLGPLVNPAGAEYQIIGVYDAALVPVMAQAVQMLGITRGLVVHGRDGEDELSITGTSLIAEIQEDGSLLQYEFDPAVHSIPLYSPQALLGANAETNARMAEEI
ncbi:MAG: bifunctional anthranilate synthase component II/anthranilate phosphoribosyltransferase, partial [Salinispira sp.]